MSETVHKYIYFICGYMGIVAAIFCVPSFIIAIFTNQLSNTFVPIWTMVGLAIGAIVGIVMAHRHKIVGY